MDGALDLDLVCLDFGADGNEEEGTVGSLNKAERAFMPKEIAWVRKGGRGGAESYLFAPFRTDYGNCMFRQQLPWNFVGLLTGAFGGAWSAIKTVTNGLSVRQTRWHCADA